MKLISKFSINDQVVVIQNQRTKSYEKCNICLGERSVAINGEKFLCPACNGCGGGWEYGPNKWQVSGFDKVGSVRIEATNIESDGDFDNIGHFKEGATTIEIRYMLYGTGIGSGTTWSKDKLFINHKEAEAACERLNLEDN